MVNPERNQKMDYSLNSYAKINLFLDVISRLPNAYHEIFTIFAEIELCDKLKFFLTNKQEIKIVSNIGELNNSENLIYKVAIYLKDRFCVDKGVLVELEKNIPIAAGLGGGSSNAAATIKALSILWDLNLSLDEMNNIAALFGSDINFFLTGGTSIGRNRGEIIESIDDIIINHILLINPNIQISSKTAYQAVQITHPNHNWQSLIKEKSSKYCYNKLEEGIALQYPIIKQLTDQLLQLNAEKAMLSGSGSTVIGFFNDEQKCKNAQELFAKEGFWSYITTTRRRLKE